MIKLVSGEMKVNELHTLRKSKIKIKLNLDTWIFFYYVTNDTNKKNNPKIIILTYMKIYQKDNFFKNFYIHWYVVKSELYEADYIEVLH